VVAERDAAQAKVASLQSDITEAENQIDSLEGDLAGVESELADVESELGTVKEERDKVQGDLSSARSRISSLQGEVSSLKSDLGATSAELDEIKEVYPPREFSTTNELRDWLMENDVSDRPAAENAENLYLRALEIQEDALEDGYIISAWIDYEGERIFSIACTAVVNGEVWVWGPSSDEPVNFSDQTDLLKLK
jgi:chromosome segregation ATPase